MKNYRTKKYTTRLSPINQSQINKLRSTQLKHATSYKQKKFIRSKEFDKQVRRQIRVNRFNANKARLDRIASSIGESTEQKRFFRSFFGEKSVRTSSGGKRRVNTFTSQAQTKRLKTIEKQLASNKFNLKRRVQNTKKYKEIKKYLPDDASQSELATSLNRNAFYFENRTLIRRHNRNVQRHGVAHASGMKTGKDLRNQYVDSQNEEDADLIKMLI